MTRKPYPPGMKGKRRFRGLSEFGRQLREKQKLRMLYGLREAQFKNYVKRILGKRGKVGDAAQLLICALEMRLDNVVFRLGIASSRLQARQLVSHKFFCLNGKPINTPSYKVKVGDIISLKPQKTKKAIFQNLVLTLKNYQPPAWLELNKEKIEGKVLKLPTVEEAGIPAETGAIFEFYSR